ncbi:MAG TPA: DUF1707 domain-containing protein [Solirubrobacteraceae bacterium]
MSDPSSLRAADAEREQLADELREHLIAGRLSSEEFEERVGRAYKAATRSDLEALKADLPMTQAALSQALLQRKTKLRRRLLGEGGGALGISSICVAVCLGSGANGSFWPAWVMAVALLPVVRNAWRLFGPSPDLEAVEAYLSARRARRLARERRHSRHRELPR